MGFNSGFKGLKRQGRQFSRLLAAEVCASAVVMLDTPCFEVVWRVLATHSIRQFPLQFSSLASPCAITFQLDSTMTAVYYSFEDDVPYSAISKMVFFWKVPGFAPLSWQVQHIDEDEYFALMERYWHGETRRIGKNLSWYKFVYHKPHMDWPEIDNKT